jgi:hypothetical protein
MDTTYTPSSPVILSYGKYTDDVPSPAADIYVLPPLFDPRDHEEQEEGERPFFKVATLTMVSSPYNWAELEECLDSVCAAEEPRTPPPSQETDSGKGKEMDKENASTALLRASPVPSSRPNSPVDNESPLRRFLSPANAPLPPAYTPDEPRVDDMVDAPMDAPVDGMAEAEAPSMVSPPALIDLTMDDDDDITESSRKSRVLKKPVARKKYPVRRHGTAVPRSHGLDTLDGPFWRTASTRRGAPAISPAALAAILANVTLK